MSADKLAEPANPLAFPSEESDNNLGRTSVLAPDQILFFPVGILRYHRLQIIRGLPLGEVRGEVRTVWPFLGGTEGLGGWLRGGLDLSVS